MPPPRKVLPMPSGKGRLERKEEEAGKEREQRKGEDGKLWERLDELEREEEEYLKREEEEGIPSLEGGVTGNRLSGDKMAVRGECEVARMPPASDKTTQHPGDIPERGCAVSSGDVSSVTSRSAGSWGGGRAGHLEVREGGEGGGGGGRQKVLAGSGSPTPLRITVKHTRDKGPKNTEVISIVCIISPWAISYIRVGL